MTLAAVMATRAPRPAFIRREAIRAAEAAADEVVLRVQPTEEAERTRQGIIGYLKLLFGTALGCEVRSPPISSRAFSPAGVGGGGATPTAAAAPHDPPLIHFFFSFSFSQTSAVPQTKKKRRISTRLWDDELMGASVSDGIVFSSSRSQSRAASLGFGVR